MHFTLCRLIWFQKVRPSNAMLKSKIHKLPFYLRSWNQEKTKEENTPQYVRDFKLVEWGHQVRRLLDRPIFNIKTHRVALLVISLRSKILFVGQELKFHCF